MKILYFYQYFGTPQGSWSTRVYELCRRWVKNGNEVTVVTAPYDKSDIKGNGFVSKKEIEGVQLIIINSGDSNRFPVLKRVFRAVRFAIASIYFALRLDYQIAIASSGPITIGLPMIFAKLLRNKKTVFEVRDLWPAGGIEMGLIKSKWQKKLALWFEKLCYNKSDLVVASSPGQRDHIIRRFPDVKIKVIPNASDLDLFGSYDRQQLPGWTKDKILFTHIGSLGFIHNCILHLKALKILNDRGYKDKLLFVFIGDGAEREELEEFAYKNGLTNAYFLGLKPKSELPKWVQQSRATLFSTLNNPVQNTCSPNKIFDSFAAGTPVIQTTTGWIRDLIDEHQCGINVAPDDPEALADAVIKMINDSNDEREKMRQNGKHLAETLFNRDILAKDYLEDIEQIVFDKKKPLKAILKTSQT